MTKAERHQQWQEIFDRYDKAVAEFHHSSTLMQRVAPQLNQLIATLDETAAISKRMMDATMAANRAALALYRDEQEGPTE